MEDPHLEGEAQQTKPEGIAGAHHTPGPQKDNINYDIKRKR